MNGRQAVANMTVTPVQLAQCYVEPANIPGAF